RREEGGGPVRQRVPRRTGERSAANAAGERGAAEPVPVRAKYPVRRRGPERGPRRRASGPRDPGAGHPVRFAPEGEGGAGRQGEHARAGDASERGGAARGLAESAGRPPEGGGDQ